jgi:TfoX/Sxy family transcriptional regulator of competence genes
MPYDKKLAERVRKLLEGQKGLTEKEMFGAIGFMVRGNMCCGVLKDELIVRLAAEEHEAAMKEPNTRVFDFTGRPMKGWLVVTSKGCASKGLQSWVKRSLEFALTLPAK